MNQIRPKSFRILAITPSTRGFGFAVLEGEKTLVDWGTKPARGDKNAQSLVKVEDLIVHYQPDILVLEDALAKNSRRSSRIKELSQQIIALAGTCKTKVTLFSREQVRCRFFEDGEGTKHALATIIAGRFPAELGSILPPKRRLWASEDRSMDIFDAVAVALVLRLKTQQSIG